MTPRFLFPARVVTKNPSVWIRHLNYFFHRASFTIYLQYTKFHTLSWLSSHPNLEYSGDLAVSMTLWVQNRLLQEWGLHRLSEHQEMHFMFLSEHYGLDCSAALLCLLWSRIRSNCSAWLAGGNVWFFNQYVHAQCHTDFMDSDNVPQ